MLNEIGIARLQQSLIDDCDDMIRDVCDDDEFVARCVRVRRAIECAGDDVREMMIAGRELWDRECMFMHICASIPVDDTIEGDVQGRVRAYVDTFNFD